MLILPHSTAEVNNFLESFPNVFQTLRKTASLPVAALAAFIKYLHSPLRGYRPHAQDLRCSVPTDLRLFRYGIFVSLRGGSVTPPRTRARHPRRLPFLAQEKPQRHRHPSYLPDAPLFVFPSASSLLVPSPPESSSLPTPQLLRRLSHLPCLLACCPLPFLPACRRFPRHTRQSHFFIIFSLSREFSLDKPRARCYNSKAQTGRECPGSFLGVAQLVARYLGVVEAAGSSPVTQTIRKLGLSGFPGSPFFGRYLRTLK